MSENTVSWVEELEQRYGVRPEFSLRLSPILECLASCSLDEDQRSHIFASIAAAYRRSEAEAMVPEAASAPRAESLDEVRLLVTQFITELRKMEESFKVLDVMLRRVREHVLPPARPRLLH